MDRLQEAEIGASREIVECGLSRENSSASSVCDELMTCNNTNVPAGYGCEHYINSSSCR